MRAVFDAPTTTARERKQLLRTVIDEMVITVHRDVGRADLRIIWQSGATPGAEHDGLCCLILRRADHVP